MLATGGLYAPTIRYNNGTVYIVCTNIIYSEESTKNITENFAVSTQDIWAGEWSDPVYFDFKGIDPSLFFDDDGRVYMHGSAAPGPMTTIHLFEIDLKTGKKLSEEKKIWGGTGGIYPEGPHIYKKDGWYYLMISEGGTHENHMITVARSKDVWGPYDAFGENPILTAQGTDEYIRYTGHCDMFSDQEGRWWGVCLGVRKKESRFIMGRETFLFTGEWGEGEWPKLNQVILNPVLADGTKLSRPEYKHTPLSSEALVDFLYIRDAKLSNYKFLNNNMSITLKASSGDVSKWEDQPTFVGKRQRLLEGCSAVTLRRPSDTTKVEAGLVYYKDEHRYIKLLHDFETSKLVFEVINNAKHISRKSSQSVVVRDYLDLRVDYTETSYKFSALADGGPSAKSEWKHAGEVDTLEMTGPDFVGPIIGIFAQSTEESVSVQFDDLHID